MGPGQSPGRGFSGRNPQWKTIFSVSEKLGKLSFALGAYWYAVYIEYRFLVLDIKTKPNRLVSNKISNLDFGALKQFSMPQTVFAKTAGLTDKTAKFQKCPANFVSLSDSMSDEKLNHKNALTVFLGDLVFNR